MYLREGYIVQSDGDYGDTAHRHGFWQLPITLRWMLDLPALHKDYGVISWQSACTKMGFPDAPIRSPWGNANAGIFSRDQGVPNLCVLKLLDASSDQKAWDDNLCKKWNSKIVPKFPNGDLATPQIFNLLRPVSTTGLLELLFNSLMCSAKVRINRDDTDQTLNTFAMFATLYTKHPKNLILKACRLVFKYGHPGVKASLHSYFRPEMGGNIECAQIWDPIVDKLLS